MNVVTLLTALIVTTLSTVTTAEYHEQLVAVQDEKIAEAQFRYQGKSYQNKFDLPLHFECNARNGEALNQVRSAFHNRYKDRVWSWGCKKAASVPLTDCSWSGHINNWQRPVRFMCPKGKIMTGVDSKHWNSKEDRRWKIKCCSAKGYHTQECELTKQVNGARAYFEHKASPATSKKTCSRKNRHKEKPDEEVFVGMVSNWRGNDRKWQIIECEFAKDDDKDDKNRNKRRRYHRRRYRGRKHHHDDDTHHRKGCDHGRCDSDKSKSHDKSDDSSRSRSHDSKSRSHDSSSRSHKTKSKSDDSRSKSHDRSKSSRDKSHSRSHDTKDKSRSSKRSHSRDSRRKCKSCRDCNSCGGHE